MRDVEIRMLLAKEDFKFSAAHFTIFDDQVAEALHGHNYRVEVELIGRRLDALGFLVDIAAVKKTIRGLCADLDEQFLIPGDCDLLEVQSAEGQLVLAYSDRRYELPAADVVVLPLANVTIEELARYLWLRLVESLPREQIDRMTVTVGETSGQRASWTATLD